jgi:BirA family biotin operon repressor/biotin-[acetyl-CoA-carboxylase] ligase
MDMVAGASQARPPETAADLLHPEHIARALGECRIGAKVRYETRVDSTNRLARELGRQGACEGVVVIADEQTSGRGRRQRSWVSPAGKGIYVSILLRPAGPAADVGAAVQLAAGIAAAETLASHCSRPVTLRWPNDCYSGDRKIAGVLVESGMTGSALDFVVCGIGLNVNHEETDFPPLLRSRATSLRILSGSPQSRLPVLVDLLRAFEHWDDEWRRHGLAPIVERWHELSPESRGSYVEIRTPEGMIRGIAAGLSPAGGLWVEEDERGRREITLGELVRLSPYTSVAQRRTS